MNSHKQRRFGALALEPGISVFSGASGDCHGTSFYTSQRVPDIGASSLLSMQPLPFRIQVLGIRCAIAVLLWIGLLAAPSTTRAQAIDSDHDGLSDDYERGVGRYSIILGTFTWTEAKADAEARGGHLATIVSEQEWIDMKAVLGPSLFGKNLWIGGTDEGNEGVWRWITGERWVYSHWRAKEPSNDSIGNGTGDPENYLMVWGKEVAATDHQEAYWNDVLPNGGLLARDGYILEYGYWTDMTDPDTDDDGLSDREEIFQEPFFEIIHPPVSWPVAASRAAALGGRLAIIPSLQDWVKIQTILGTDLRNSDLWLGGSNLDSGFWRWVNGDPISAFLNWDTVTGQPGRVSGYLYMRSGTSKWAAQAATDPSTYGFVLERFGAYHTDPNNPDTDGDGLRDGDEVHFFKTDPTLPDTDHDSLSDFEEIRQWKTDPLVKDTDGDGLSDGDEVLVYHSNPLKTDSDGDGYADPLEVAYGSSPTDASSVPSPPHELFTAVEIEFPTVVNEIYQIQQMVGNWQWQNFGPRIPGTGKTISYLVSTRSSSSSFYRVVLAH